MRCWMALILLALVPVLMCLAKAISPHGMSRADRYGSHALEELRIKAQTLSTGDVRSFENRLKQDPEDAELHGLLALYYIHLGLLDPAPAECRAHAMWIIRNHPGTTLAGELEGLSCEEGCHAWDKSVQRYPDDPWVLGNAGHFFLRCGSERAEALLRKAHRLDATNPKWSAGLGLFYTIKYDPSNHTKTGPEQRVEFARNALVAYEQALQYSEARPTNEVLKQVMLSALRAGELTKAKSYAREFVDSSIEDLVSRRDMYSNSNVLGNLVIGHTALVEGNTLAAESQLIRIASVAPPTHVLLPGPMDLAQELLQRRRREAVLEYLRRCERISKSSRITEWIAQIEAGETPSFNTGPWY